MDGGREATVGLSGCGSGGGGGGSGKLLPLVSLSHSCETAQPLGRKIEVQESMWLFKQIKNDKSRWWISICFRASLEPRFRYKFEPGPMILITSARTYFA